MRVAGVSAAQGIPNFKNYNITMFDTANTQLDMVGKVSSNAFPVNWLAAGNTVLPTG